MIRVSVAVVEVIFAQSVDEMSSHKSRTACDYGDLISDVFVLKVLSTDQIELIFMSIFLNVVVVDGVVSSST